MACTMPVRKGLTDEQIKELRRISLKAGDVLQAAICDMALGMDYSGCTPSDGYVGLSRAERRRLDEMTMSCARAACHSDVRRDRDGAV